MGRFLGAIEKRNRGAAGDQRISLKQDVPGFGGERNQRFTAQELGGLRRQNQADGLFRRRLAEQRNRDAQSEKGKASRALGTHS